MIEVQDIARAAEAGLAGMANAGSEKDAASEKDASSGKESGEGGLFVVDVKVRGGDEFEVFIDSDAVWADGRPRGVSVEDCVALTKAIEGRFDRESEDFSLTVSSAGIGQPLRVPRQYRKLVGRQVEVVLGDGTKIVATLEDAGDESITLSYPEKRRIEGKKKPEIVAVTATFALKDVKTTREHIDFK